jgi:hypothetical protein
MSRAIRAASTLAVAVVVAGASALCPPDADAHGRGRHGVVYVGGGFYSPWYGFGFGPYWGWGWGWGAYPPAYYGPPGGVDMGMAMMAGFGAVELNAKPNRADVWIDGKYVGEARDLDGYPSYLWLKEGEHRIAVHKGGFLVFDEPIAVQRGMKTQIKVRLQPGDSPPPGQKPAARDKADEAPKDERKE